MEGPGVNASRDKNSTLTLVLIGIVIILCLGFIVVIIGYVGLTTGTNKDLSTTNSTNQQNNIVATNPNIQILSPAESSTINGLIEVKGISSYHFKNLKIELFDFNQNLLATSNVSVSAPADGNVEWLAKLDVINSPSSSNGKIVVTSTEPAFEKSIDIKFEIYSNSPNNLIVYAPLNNQVMFSNNLSIRGEAKGLFEGNLQIRLLDEENNEVYSDSLTIPDQYEEFRKFEYLINLENLSLAEGKSGRWEFYYQSAMDGSEVILQSIPIRFL